jgi:hypothetical protein
VNHGVGVVPENGNGQQSLSTTVADYFAETNLSKKPKTLAAYSTALAYFVEPCHKINLADVDRKDLFKSPRSCATKKTRPLDLSTTSSKM